MNGRYNETKGKGIMKRKGGTGIRTECNGNDK